MPNHFLLRALGLALALPCLSQAASLEVNVEIPVLDSPKYHRPYLAIWIETFDQQPIADLAVWYKIGAPNNKGKQWLPDLKQWWKRSGHQLELPVDGISGATRGPGVYSLRFDDSSPALKKLKPGKYYLSVEATREENKHDVRHEQRMISFNWPPEKPESRQANGKTELGAISLLIKP